MANAEELWQAATELREKAEAATDGPWGVESAGASLAVLSYPGCGAFVANLGSKDDEQTQLDGDWIALVHPELAEPLADLLDVIAELFEGLGDREPAADTWQGMGLRIARAINGPAS